MTKKSSLVIMTVDPEEIHELTLDELCAVCRITPDFIEEIMAYGILEPEQRASTLVFNKEHLRRVRTVVNLLQQLEVNLAGAALALELIDEIDELRARLDTFERYFEQ